jgi:hypothetical protein
LAFTGNKYRQNQLSKVKYRKVIVDRCHKKSSCNPNFFIV